MRGPFGQTRRVVARVLARNRYRRLVAAVGILYLVVFLIALGNITPSTGEFSVTTGSPAAMFRRTGLLLFDAVARIRTPLFTLLVSPLNIAMGLVISFLVGLNLTMTYIAWRQPKACPVNKATGVFGLAPALLAGGACCAPTILLILGIQATAAFITAVQWMIPLALALLVGSLALIARKTQLEML